MAKNNSVEMQHFCQILSATFICDVLTLIIVSICGKLPQMKPVLLDYVHQKQTIP